jgi:excisionase family DNA binding protein
VANRVVMALPYSSQPYRQGFAHILYMTQNPEILSVNEVAALLRCSKAHVCKAIRGRVSGVTSLPAISMGRRKLIRRQSLEAWLAQNDPVSAGDILDRSHNGSP